MRFQSSTAHCLAHLVLILTISLFAGLSPGLAQENSQPASMIRAWQKQLDDMEQELADAHIPDERLAELRESLVREKAEMLVAREEAVQKASVIRHDTEALGPPPARGAHPEAPTIKARRKELSDELASVEGVIKETELLVSRVDRFSQNIKRQRINRITDQTFSRSLSPLDATVWREAWLEVRSLVDDVSGDIRSLYGAAGQGPERIRRLLEQLALAIVLAFPLRQWLVHRYVYPSRAGTADYLHRLWSAFCAGLARAWLPSVLAITGYLGLASNGLPAGPGLMLIQAMAASFIVALLIAGMSHAALDASYGKTRIVRVHGEAAQAISRAVDQLALVFALDFALRQIFVYLDVSAEIITLQKFVFSLLVALALTGLLRCRVWTTGGDAAGIRTGWKLLRGLLIALAVLIPLASLSGFVLLANVLATHLVLSLALLALTLGLLDISDQTIGQLMTRKTGNRTYAGESPGDGLEMLGFWINASVKVLVSAAGLFGIVLLWTLDRKDLLETLWNAFFSIRMGGISLSPARILLGLFAFALLLGCTRITQRMLENRLFPRMRVDLGVRHSIRSAVGYLGFVLALMLGISIMGVNLSSLAIVAGALSVGIGFGLQTIVNNFVSGLILLIERPIKAGDLVAVGEYQGYVRKISVRATEITTSDRASVFIPNSSLIAGAVMNRTYADKVGRVVVPVALAHEADPTRAAEILMEIAAGHPDIRHHPSPPRVFMKGYGENALNLELVALVCDVDHVKSVASDLYFAIHEAFRHHGIPMPYSRRESGTGLNEELLKRLFAQFADPTRGTDLHLPGSGAEADQPASR